MRAPLRVLVAATALAGLGTLGLAYGAHAASPQVDQRHVDRQHPTRHDHDQAWRCHAGHGPQLDCRDAASFTGSQPSTSPPASVPAGGGTLDLVRSVALLGLLAALAAAGTWLRRRHRPREAT